MNNDALFAYISMARHDRGWTIPEFAEHCHVSAQLAYKWLAEDPVQRITPGPASCEKIAAAFGTDPDYILELAGHRKGRESRRVVDVQRQAVRDQLESWLAAVGPEYEPYFWESLKAHAQSTTDLILGLRSAVSTAGDGAVSGADSGLVVRNRKRGADGNEPLVGPQHTVNGLLTRAQSALNVVISPKRLQECTV